MTIRVLIAHDDVQSDRRLQVSVVQVGQVEEAHERRTLAPGETVHLHVHAGQFLIVDELPTKGEPT